MANVLCLVPARGGSKGIPAKNLRMLGDRPLLSYALEPAREAGIKRVVLSTDSHAIADLGRSIGLEVPFMRPAELATDEAPMLPVVQHAVRAMDEEGFSADIVVLLQPTSPFRRAEHVRAALDLLESARCDSVVSVVEVPRHFSPQYVMKVEEGRLISYLPEGQRLVRRQDALPAYSRDGTVYAIRRQVIMELNSLYGEDCRPLIIPSDESINLDTAEDWALAESRLAERTRDSQGALE